MAQHIAISGELTTVTEKLMVKAILKHLRAEDAPITGLRLHDHEYGDVEIDAVQGALTCLGRLSGSRHKKPRPYNHWALPLHSI